MIALALFLAMSGRGDAQDPYKFDLSEIEKEIDKTADKSYSLTGFLEYQPVIFGIDRDAALSRIRFFRRDRGSAFDQHGLRLRLEGSYRWHIFSGFIKSDTQMRNDFEGWDEDTRLFEAYGSMKPNPNLIFEAGKKVMKWGKGYAWNPVSFIDRPKNPEDPEEALEGSTVFTSDFIRSFDGPLKTVTLTAAVIPVYEHINANFGVLKRTNFAAKLYTLLYDTDIDVMMLTGSSRTTRYGFDFSKNLTTNFEIHGELARINNLETTTIDKLGRASRNVSDPISFLLGVRYLTEQETTYVFEYYNNGAGFTRKQMKDFLSFVENSYEQFGNTGVSNGMRQASQLADGAYGRPNPGGHYLYFRATQKEPYDILYFIPGVTAIVNLTDASLTLIPEITYSPMTNLDIRFRTAVLLGKDRTEFGARQNDYRVELRLRYYFQF
jgi:hypothetical protein